MLYLQSFTFNPFQENTYLIINDKKECWIVDPGMYEPAEKEHLFRYIADNQLVPKAIINTHTHIDHILGVQAVIDKYNIPFLIHEKDLQILHMAPASAAIFGIQFKDILTPTSFISESEPLKLGADTVEVKFVPGHSPGSIAFYYQPGNWVIAGDVLFQRSIGRTDLPGGNHNTLINSIKTELMVLDEAVTVHPGHGPATTIGEEKQDNPFL